MMYLGNIKITGTLNKEIETLINKGNYSKYFLVADQNTAVFCLPWLFKNWPAGIQYEIIKIPAGENHKTLTCCKLIWQKLSRQKADRKALLINLGGGVLCDMGGFCAATYKRGIDFINIPTTLLAMVDAAIGGKTGVDLGFFKNQVGVFAFPRAVIIDPAFLNTLPYDELKNGYAEIIKHALIADNSLWLTLQKDGFNQVSNLIEKSMVIKTEIVSKDPYEKDRRKLLNFGHTVGHALEMLSQEPTGRQLAHGEAVAEGIIAESYISVKMTGLPTAEADQIKHFIRRFFPVPTFYKSNFEAVYELMLNDKKNVNGALKMTLLKSIGKGIINISVSKKIIMECLKASLMP